MGKNPRFMLAACLSLSAVGGASEVLANVESRPIPAPLKAALDGVDAKPLLDHIRTLSSDEYGGRAPAGEGAALTVAYLVEAFKQARLQPGNADGSYVQRVPLTGITTQSKVAVERTREPVLFDAARDFVLRSRHREPETAIQASPIVFVGFGIRAPEYGWDDYAGLDVRGKTLIMLDGEPEEATQTGESTQRFKGKLRTYYSTRSYKFELAARLGAAVAFVVHDPKGSHSNFEALQNSYRREFFEMRAGASPPLVEGWLSREATQRLCRAQGMDFERLARAATATGNAPVPLGATLALTIANRIREVDSFNVVARLQGSDPVLADTAVLYSAHWDHLGRDDTREGDRIFNGAIDNAGGVAMLLEIARGFAGMETAPKRSLLFLATTAEEIGMLGARYYTAQPLHPLERTVAAFNLDSFNAWGATNDVLNMGYGLTTLDGVLERAAKLQGRHFVAEPFAGGSYFFLSDQLEFAKAGIPSAFPGSGSDYVGRPKGYGDAKWGEYGENSYHQVGDEMRADWDLAGAVQDVRWLLLAGYEVAQATPEPQWAPGAEFSRAPGTVGR